MVQDHVLVRGWRFKSSRPHQARNAASRYHKSLLAAAIFGGSGPVLLAPCLPYSVCSSSSVSSYPGFSRLSICSPKRLSVGVLGRSPVGSRARPNRYSTKASVERTTTAVPIASRAIILALPRVAPRLPVPDAPPAARESCLQVGPPSRTEPGGSSCPPAARLPAGHYPGVRR